MSTGKFLRVLLVLPLVAAAVVVDRVAVVVGNKVITESEVLDELRIEEFLNNQPLVIGPQERRAAAERLVDQQLVRNEMELGQYEQPTPEQADAMMRKFRQERFPSVARFQAALEQYGITEEQLKQHLLWQLMALRFTDLRFRPLTEGSNVQTANRVRAGAPIPPSGNTVDEQMESWLKQQRDTTRVVFKPEAFQ